LIGKTRSIIELFLVHVASFMTVTEV